MTRKLINAYLPYRRSTGIALTAILCILVGTLVLTLPPGRAGAASSVQVTINANQSLGALTSNSIGLNTTVWDGTLLSSATYAVLKQTSVGMLRYPGGSISDIYHWQSHSEEHQGYVNAKNTFDAYMSVAKSLGAQPLIAVNYGTGTVQEAAGWVQYANKGGPSYNGPVPSYPGASKTGHNYGIKYWEVGNEIYGNGTYGTTWEADKHAQGPATYASNVVAYSKAMKAVDPSIKVGAVLTAPGNWPDGLTNAKSPQPWNQTVLATACTSIDLAIIHWYPQNPGSESDSGLLSASSSIANMVSTLRSQLQQYCGSHASAIQIYVTETNSVSSAPGKQTVSLVNALFLADDYFGWLENGVANVDWWDLHDGEFTDKNNSSSLYGDAQFGDYGVLSSGQTSSGISEPPVDTPFPAYYGLQMLRNVGRAGDTLVSSSSSQNLLAVHAVRQANGKLAVLLINKDPDNSYTISLSLNGYSANSTATVYTYGENNSTITSISDSLSSVTVGPYSLTTVVMQPGSGVAPTPITPIPMHTPVATPAHTPTVMPTSTPIPTPTPITSTSCSVHYVITNQWRNGFGATITITNTGSTVINGWTLKFSFANGQTVTQFWNGSVTQSGSAVTVTNTPYNASIPAGGTLNSSPGFNSTWNGTNAAPTAFTLNGSSCSIM